MQRIAFPPMLAIDRTSGTPIHQQLCDGFRKAIVERRLLAGQRLPSTRALAADLGVSRTPLLLAFQQLRAEGYFESRHGSGTFVSRTLPGPINPSVRPPSHASGPRRLPVQHVSATAPWLAGLGAFRVGEPEVGHFPFRIWSRLVARQTRAMRRDRLFYQSPLGDLSLRQALATYLRTSRGVRCDAGQIMIVNGSQQALGIVARALLDPGATVWVEEPGYGGARDALTMAGAILVPVPVDQDGIDVAAGMRSAPAARAALVTPSHQYPLGVTMPAARRLQLLDWAQSAGAWIIEDDYDSEFRFEGQPVAALQGIDRDARVIYIGTFSKVLFPALRLGYLVLPADLVPHAASVREAMDIAPPSLVPAALADFLLEGHFSRYLRRTSLIYHERRNALVESLRHEFGDSWQIVGAEAGMHLAVLRKRTTSTSNDIAVAQRAASEGLWVMPLSACCRERPRHDGFVLGYAATDAAEIPAAVQRLARLIDGD